MIYDRKMCELISNPFHQHNWVFFFPPSQYTSITVHSNFFYQWLTLPITMWSLLKVLGFPFPLLPQSLRLPLQLPAQSSTCLTLVSPLLIMIMAHCILCLFKLGLSSIQIKVSRNIVQEQRLQMLPKPQGKPMQRCSLPTSTIWWSYNEPRCKKSPKIIVGR